MNHANLLDGGGDWGGAAERLRRRRTSTPQSLLFTSWEDAPVVLMLLLPMLAMLGLTAWMWLRRTDVAVRAKGIGMVTLQSLAGFLWFFGFLVRNGHFVRWPESTLSNCNLWWFWISMVAGFGVWAGCIVARLARLFSVFVVGKPLKTHWLVIVAAIDVFFLAYYGIFLPSVEAVEFRYFQLICIYRHRIWVFLDFFMFLMMFVLMLGLLWQLRNVRDQLGENASVRRALLVAFAMWSLSLAVQIFQIDDRWYGRALLSTSVMGAVVAFFVVQAGESVIPLLNRSYKSQISAATASLVDPDEESQTSDNSSMAINAFASQSGGLIRARSISGNGNPISPTGAQTRQRMFSQAVLGKL